jgi:hypothetical protein
MDWDAIGATGEIIGALAVVATLLYLARQTRVSGKASISASRSASAVAMSELDRDLARDPELARIFLKSTQLELADYDDLEWNRFTGLARSIIGLIEESYIQSIQETTDPEIADIQIAAVIGLIEYPAWRQFWNIETLADGWRKAFVDAVNDGRTSASFPASVIAGRRSENAEDA